VKIYLLIIVVCLISYSLFSSYLAAKERDAEEVRKELELKEHEKTKQVIAESVARILNK